MVEPEPAILGGDGAALDHWLAGRNLNLNDYLEAA